VQSFHDKNSFRAKSPVAVAEVLVGSEGGRFRNGSPFSSRYAADIDGSQYFRWLPARCNCNVQVDGAGNSRHPSGPALVYTRAEISAFLAGVKDGEFDDLT
jgi:hypothetical protein